MTALLDRLDVATAGHSVLGSRGRVGAWRMAALSATRSRSADAAPATTFSVLLTAPDWLRWKPEWQTKLANAVALGAAGSQLICSIDGKWLGALADVAGEAALDWAIRRHESGRDNHLSAETGGNSATWSEPMAETLTDRGFAILAATLPPALATYAPRPSAQYTVTPSAELERLVEDAVAFIRAQRDGVA